MKLTTAQRSEIISEMDSSVAGFNELIRVLWNRFSKQDCGLFLDEKKGELGNGSVLVFGVVTVAAFKFSSLALARMLLNRSYSGSRQHNRASVRCFS